MVNIKPDRKSEVPVKIEDIFGELPVLETERMRLRKIVVEDARDLFAYCSDEEVSRYTTWDTHQTIEHSLGFIRYIRQLYGTKQVAPWGIEDKRTNRLIGTVGFVYWHPSHSRAELGYALARPYWNQGVGTEVVRRTILFGFEQMKLVRLEARCHPDNIASFRVMEKAGMSYEGILRKHTAVKRVNQDVKLYSILKEEFDAQYK
ncbi:GNAT family N-acetyltransferase [Paenibacillus turpanensis]|uniref:GNAT family N-acetyltransferase n=1 Tax=Paenibacillus turpanensis TaxID=2689078 RepID=UPI001A9E65CC|nr:GNAT family protein [Paenibacillus turpanensis]